MKLPCEMVQDLLPLYHDNVCSEVSRTLVGEHLKNCEDCTRVLGSIQEEIEVPKLEADAAKPLLSIQINWKKQTRKAKLKYIGLGVVMFFLCITLWWTLTQWSIVPLKASDYIIKEAEQLKNGVIHIEYTLMYKDTQPHEGVTEDGILYDYRTRPILAKRRDQIPTGSAGIWIDPEDLNWFGGETFHAFCLGDPNSKEHILIWEVGKELPPASALSEEMFADLESAFAAPNAPEKPNPVTTRKVVHENGEIYGIDGDEVVETMVSGTDAAEQ